ncbi:hypothetical protein MRS44_013786 [Fusarium solani]|uniref:uncharacterized protein n=1 Tax=Fusarium solani TaxID=169388 RepID=UPI0032C49FAC|nr:hypothetical protein MRS44_013786 [Fusarium solani]
MDSEVIAAWICDQHLLLHTCSDPQTCSLPLEYEYESSTSPSPRRRRHVLGLCPSAKRQRIDSAGTDPISDGEAPRERDMRRSPRKKDDNHPDQQDPFTSDDNDADIAAHQVTPRPRRSIPQQRQQLHHVFPPPMSFTAKLSTSDRQSFASGSRERSSATSRTRSTSPIKNPDDLLKLEKPVTWTSPDPRTLRDTVKKTGSAQALGLFDDVWRVIQGEGYLPRELKKILKDELMVSESRFAAEDRVLVVDKKEVDDASQLFPSFDAGIASLLALYNELSAIRNIVATTIRFINTTRSEATWNDHIHGPALRLAVSGIPHVGAENITQAAIAKAFIPPSRGELETLGGKMIDYALLLQPDRDLAIRIADFVDGFDGPRSFNQSTHGPLCYEPTGVLVETKVDIRRRAEGKAQLGVWLAAWYGRVAKFAPLPPEDPGTLANLPFLPVLLVVCENWELYFAFDRDGEVEVCGPLEIGSTVTVDGSYRLLAVLRLLAGWVNQEFRGWVERCVS